MATGIGPTVCRVRRVATVTAVQTLHAATCRQPGQRHPLKFSCGRMPIVQCLLLVKPQCAAQTKKAVCGCMQECKRANWAQCIPPCLHVGLRPLCNLLCQVCWHATRLVCNISFSPTPGSTGLGSSQSLASSDVCLTRSLCHQPFAGPSVTATPSVAMLCIAVLTGVAVQ